MHLCVTAPSEMWSFYADMQHKYPSCTLLQKMQLVTMPATSSTFSPHPPLSEHPNTEPSSSTPTASTSAAPTDTPPTSTPTCTSTETTSSDAAQSTSAAASTAASAESGTGTESVKVVEGESVEEVKAPEFRDAARKFMLQFVRKGTPALFVTIKPLYNDPLKVFLRLADIACIFAFLIQRI